MSEAQAEPVLNPDEPYVSSFAIYSMLILQPAHAIWHQDEEYNEDNPDPAKRRWRRPFRWRRLASEIAAEK